MKKTVMALAVSAGLALAPTSAALANTVTAQPEDTISSAWVPATLAEQQAARGGGGYSSSSLSSLFGALNTVCNTFVFNFSFRVGSFGYKRSCGDRYE